ncbi:hypothetical protein [Pseudomonas sp. SWI44]|uniref:hypothetical protein n=1 Tax=Pseudomonas sp. SWI44 TaxID=2083053 RepID=UPI000CE5DB7E|nr:hypothetical protein [Pseudomonas sp. SWI44]AVD90016.1 hypothetical protein C4Q26_23970 [Pseudomonas sp. SWI44]
MIEIKKPKEEAVELFTLLKQLFILANRHSITRKMLMAAVGIAISGSYLGTATYQLQDYRARSEAYYKAYSSLEEERRIQHALDYVQLCIDTPKDPETLSAYYCKQAVDAYQNLFAHYPGSYGAENIERAAYGAMKVDLNNKLRYEQIDRTLGDTPQMQELLKYLLTTAGLVIALLLTVTAMITTYYFFYRMNRSSVSTTDEPSDA